MSDSNQPPSPDAIAAAVEEENAEKAVSRLERLAEGETGGRKEALRKLKPLAADRSAILGPLVPSLPPFLTDEERAVRLTTAKLIVAIAEPNPGAVRPIVPALAARLADEDEFYYVRARSAEALGYVALEYPTEVTSPETLADLRIGLEFDEPEVRKKLAKALEYVALGDPGRLRHQVSTLATHLEDDDELVRYHLTTVLVAVATAHPERVAAVGDALAARLGDQSPYVRGRAAEAIGLLERAEMETRRFETDLEALCDEEVSFVSKRARFARRVIAGNERAKAGADDDERKEAGIEGIGSVESIGETTEAIVEEITAPDSDETCPHCGVALPDGGLPLCPRCGGPY